MSSDAMTQERPLRLSARERRLVLIACGVLVAAGMIWQHGTKSQTRAQRVIAGTVWREELTGEWVFRPDHRFPPKAGLILVDESGRSRVIANHSGTTVGYVREDRTVGGLSRRVTYLPPASTSTHSTQSDIETQVVYSGSDSHDSRTEP